MVFSNRLRPRIKSGEITTSIRIWQSPKVKSGGCYPMEEGHIEVESIQRIEISDITHQMAVEGGFLGVVDLLKVAQHGRGRNVYLVKFHYVEP